METKIDCELLDYDDELGIMTLDGVPFSGIAYETVPADRRYVEQAYHLGLAHGMCRTWNASKELLEEQEYAYGSKHGAFTQYGPSSRIQARGRYEKGMLVEKLEYDAAGNCVSTYAITEGSPEFQTLELLRRVEFPGEFQ